MRTSVAAFAVFRRAPAAGVPEWLAQWNDKWHAFHLVGGHKRADESFHTCCVREIAEELRLVEGRDFRVQDRPLAHLEYVAPSASAGVETACTVELFDAVLLGDAARGVTADPANRWLSESDVRARRCRDGKPVSDTLFRLLGKAGLIAEEFDLFVSYAHKDDTGGWVTALVQAIRDEHAGFTNVPLRVFFDRADIHDMDDWEHRILHGLRSAKVMLAVLSPSYVASPFCRREWQTYLDHELELTLPGDGITPVYTVTVPEFEGDESALRDALLRNLRQRQYLDARPWFAEGAEALRREDVRQRLRLLDQQIDERLRRAERAAASPTHSLPGHNRNFVGRADELRQLREALARGRVGAIAAVQGIGGIGKSALAFEYAHGFAEHYPGGRYVLRAEGADDFRALFVDQVRTALGIELSDDEKKSYDLSFPRVWQALRDRGRSLLVLDNLDRPELLAGARQRGDLPAGDTVHVMATTRLEPRQLDNDKVQCLTLDALPDEDGLQLLEKYRKPADGDEWKAALTMVKRLGGHCLALEVVGVFLWKTPEVSYRDYLARLEAEGIGAVEGAAGEEWLRLSRHPEKFIRRLLEPTLALLAPAELLALEYASLLPAEMIALPWLRTLVEKQMPEALEHRPGYADPWLQVLRRLDGLRLLIADPKEPRLARMHRVVQDVVAARMGEEAMGMRCAEMFALAEGRAQFLWEGWVQRGARWEIEPVQQYVGALMLRNETSGAVLASTIQAPLYHLGRHAEARSLLRRAIAIQEKAYEPDHPTLAVSYSNLATVEKALGNLAEARSLLRRAIAIEEKAFEHDHPNLAIRYWNLSQVEQPLGNLNPAKSLMRQAHAIWKARLGKQHPNTLLAQRWLLRNDPDFKDD